MNPEQSKYAGIYDSQKNGYAKNEGHLRYGHSNHGKRHLQRVVESNPEGVLDIGCGHNQFVRSVRRSLPKCKAMGADFACPSADYNIDITSELDVRDLLADMGGKRFDLLTAFDVLEHLRPEQLDTALKNMKIISKRFMFTISFRPSSILSISGDNLHPSVMPPESWGALISLYAYGVRYEGLGLFTGTWK